VGDRVLRGAFQRLQPCAGKLASTVPRRGLGRKIHPLADYAPRRVSELLLRGQGARRIKAYLLATGFMDGEIRLRTRSE